MVELKSSEVVKIYKNKLLRIFKTIYPHMTYKDLSDSIDYSISKRYVEHSAIVDNNYTKKQVELTLLELTEYIEKRQPIMTAYGVMFKKHAETANPLIELIMSFLDKRSVYKKEMFKYQKGTEKFAKYNLLQLLMKRNANSIYGCLGNAASALYNIYVAASIPAQGRALISTATMFFESFLSNNVKFGSLEEVLHFMDNVCMETGHRKYDDSFILDRNITIEECFSKIVMTCGDWRKGTIRWIPDYQDMELIYDYISHLSQENINRIYYKNNLYEFLDNSSMVKAIRYILKALKKPYLAADKVPEEIKVELDSLQDILREYVYYKYQYIDRIDRCNNMIKDVCVISDTDSTIVSFDYFYRYVLDKVQGEDILIAKQFTDADEAVKGNTVVRPYTIGEKVLSYDFYNEEIVEQWAKVRPFDIIPQNNLRYSILNIIAYIGGNLCNEYIEEFTKTVHSWAPDRKCLMYLKNEFTFYRALLTESKKNYATIQEVQEGNLIPQKQSTALDIKGLPINKSTLNPKAKEELQRILYEYILKPDKIDQVEIISQLAILEKNIISSLMSGSKEYYKPAVVKSLANYDDPMRIQGVKASMIWNMVKDDNLEAIDLNTRNKVDIIKVNITTENIEALKDTNPEIYEKFIKVFDDTYIFPPKVDPKNPTQTTTNYKKEITSVSIPVDVATPKWLLQFIDAATIVNDCISTFPMESVGINRLGVNTINYSNIVSI